MAVWSIDPSSVGEETERGHSDAASDICEDGACSHDFASRPESSRVIMLGVCIRALSGLTSCPLVEASWQHPRRFSELVSIVSRRPFALVLLFIFGLCRVQSNPISTSKNLVTQSSLTATAPVFQFRPL